MIRRVHTCIVTPEAVNFMREIASLTGTADLKLMADDPPENVISVVTVMPLTVMPDGTHVTKIEETTKS